ncbi:hypothetical protein B0H21DRAFT_761027 [Amylocystis lapponica]|nr:hypothetical protein B0H21DRAFT_761027 [Amylocystis lapponica]
MLTNGTAETEIIADLWLSFVGNCFSISYQGNLPCLMGVVSMLSLTFSLCATLFYYEYLITISQEVKLIWGRKITGVTVLFMLNRYLSLLYLAIYQDTGRLYGQRSDTCLLYSAGVILTFLWV